ncbi:YebC/PmpR family DNA-binding transcriptional regulator [Candidatus Uhrbacteria bacterium]|nr:YebC/PmpR family DNA-binding transcriptional regulator [Candidatus Uhrbacteria bacterium]
MSGHSKWATTKRQKAVVDAKRASAFTRLAHAITIAAREKGGNMEMNFSLRLAAEKARSANMPKENIERAIKRGTGELTGEQIEEVLYEGYGPEGVALMIETLTNNRNRTVSEIKHILSKHGGALGTAGSVLWMFDKKSVIGIPTNALSDERELALIEAGAEDIQKNGEETTIITSLENLKSIKDVVESLGIAPEFAEHDYIPKTNVTPSKTAQENLEKLFGELDDYPDIINYYSNNA